MGNLPTSRTITLANGDPVPSNLLNEIQDMFVGDKRTQYKSPSMPILTFATPGSYGYVIGGGGVVSLAAAAAGTGVLAIRADTGARITGLVFSAIGDGVVDVTYNLLVIAANMTATNIGTITDSNRAAAWGDVTMTVTPHTMADGEVLQLNAVANGANAGLGNIRPVFDKL